MTSPRLTGQLLVGRYRIGTVLGVGGLCVVYRGEDLTRGRAVAVKILPKEKAQVEDFALRFKREAAASQRIDHPGVVAVHDSGVLDDGALYLVMERLDGRPLSTLIEGGPFEERRALVLARQVLTALAAAHQKGYVHRDVKPKNVMVVGVAGIETVKLFDFGIASNERAAMKLTMPGTAFGTPGYISPEMAKGERVDVRADLYSVGVTLFEMLTGRLPFRCDDDIDMIRAHIQTPAPLVREIAPTVTPVTERLVARALAKAPQERFESAQAMIEAIDAILTPRRPALAPWVAIGLAAGATLAALLWRFLR